MLRRPLEPEQYTSADYVAKLDELGLRQSLGRTGICWDNALAESFFASLKNERVHHMVYPTRKKAKEDIARYIELLYNRRRIHSALDYRTPHEVRNAYMKFTARSVNGRKIHSPENAGQSSQWPAL